MPGKVFVKSEIDQQVAAALSQNKSGATLVDKSESLGYGIILTHFKNRGKKAEMHAAADDVFCILSGSGTVYLGGEIVGKEEKSPGEFLGSDIRGAETRAVAAGDIISIPRGTPHMLVCPSGEVRFLVVKVY